ncbi:hypothetical protein FXO38_04904 [Capsicum annuum]|nr:hypothetical protein FXO38_04904 [Capsicum annuum]
MSSTIKIDFVISGRSAADSHGVIKRRQLKVRDMLNLSQGECIIVEFDDVTPVREAQSLLVGFCGLLATDRCIFPIGFVKWNDSPESYFNPCFGQIIKMFETGHKPGRAELYLATHKKEDGSHVNEAAKEICVSTSVEHH